MKNAKHIFFGAAFSAVLLLALLNCNGTESRGEDKGLVTPPAQIVTVEQAKQMYDTYGKRRAPLIQRYEDAIDSTRSKYPSTEPRNDSEQTTRETRGKSFDVTRYVSYEYDTIKKYLAYIEQEAKRAGVEISTLRFYLSNYPEKDLFPKDTAARARQNSVFITPTIRKGKRDYPYYGEEGQDGHLEMVLLNDTLTKSQTQLVSQLDKKNDRSLASFLPNEASAKAPAPFFASKSYTLNKGTGAPPPYPQN